jgi:hypothetical protein
MTAPLPNALACAIADDNVPPPVPVATVTLKMPCASISEQDAKNRKTVIASGIPARCEKHRMQIVTSIENANRQQQCN